MFPRSGNNYDRRAQHGRYGIAIDYSSGNIWVADAGNSRGIVSFRGPTARLPRSAGVRDRGDGMPLGGVAAVVPVEELVGSLTAFRRRASGARG